MKTRLVFIIGLLAAVVGPLRAQDPSTGETFDQVVGGMSGIGWYSFGTGSGHNITNLSQLANVFDPYGIAQWTVIHQEWQRYQPFNSTNFVFTSNALNLTANIPSGGGLYAGGIRSGQIWTKQTFKPGVTGYNTYAFMVRMKVPKGEGAWSGSWFYTKASGQGDGSEIDNPEIFVMQNQDQYDWTGYDHGPGAGSDFFSLKSNPWTWHPGIDFSADYHDYEVVWTKDATYKYFDGRLIEGQSFRWTASGPAQMGVNLSVGTSESDLPGLKPTSLSEFPMNVSIQYISIWAK